MANKEVNELTRVDELNHNDLVTVYDVSASGSSEPIRQMEMERVFIPHYDIYNGTGNFVSYSLHPLIVQLNYQGEILKARITAYDVVSSIYWNDTDGKMTYGIKKNDDEIYSQSKNPFDAYVEFTCIDIGQVPINVRIYDQAGNYTDIDTFVLLSDNTGLCGD